MKKLVALTLLSLSLSASFAASCDHHYPNGPVRIAGNFTELCRKGYAVIHDNARKIPFLTFEYLTPQTIGRGQSERSGFKADKDLPPSARSTPKDYEKTPFYDRGHLAAAQNASDDVAMADTMLMSNIVPQIDSFNRGRWKVLETHIAKDVRRGKSLYVITGTIPSSETIGNGVGVPSHLFKVVIDKTTNETVAYLIPNNVSNRSYKSFVISVDELSKIVGVKLN